MGSNCTLTSYNVQVSLYLMNLSTNCRMAFFKNHFLRLKYIVNLQCWLPSSVQQTDSIYLYIYACSVYIYIQFIDVHKIYSFSDSFPL